MGTVTALLALGLGFLNGFSQRLVWEVAWCKSWESGGGKAEGGVERTVVGCSGTLGWVGKVFWRSGR